MSQQPTFHITKEHFVGVINSLHEQFAKDKQRSEAISEIFHAEAGYYDNSALINAIFSFLHEVFPKDEDGNCEIQNYCYCANFGKIGDSYESPEELFDRLYIARGWKMLDDPNLFKDKGVKACFKACDSKTISLGQCHCITRDWIKVPADLINKEAFFKSYSESMVSERYIAPEEAFLQDESRQFPSHKDPSKWQVTPKEMLESAERNVNHWRKIVANEALLAKTGKPSPDETA